MRLVGLWLVVATVACAIPETSQARQVSFIRDAETENTIAEYAAPLFVAAGLPAASVRIHLINDRELNAFVAGGLNLFLNTGVLMAAQDPGEVIGVIAHETGHMAAGHLTRIDDALSRSNAATILAFVVGGVVSASGQVEAGTVITGAGRDIAAKDFFSFSRTQEGSADQAALSLLNATGQSATGMLRFFERLQDQESLTRASQNPYYRTHPLTVDRINAIRQAVTSERGRAAYTPAQLAQFDRMRAKLIAYTESPRQVWRLYPETDTSVPARYAHAVLYHRLGKTDQALASLDSLLKDLPNDPYFNELQGQILFESGHAQAALTAYQRAVRLLPDSALLLGDLGRVQLALDTPEALTQAVDSLRASTRLERGNAFNWRQLGIAYAKLGKETQSALALAEEAYLSGDCAAGLYQVGKVLAQSPTGSPEWLQAEDIRIACERTQAEGTAKDSR